MLEKRSGVSKMSCCIGPSPPLALSLGNILFATTLAEAKTLLALTIVVPDKTCIYIACRSVLEDGYAGIFIYDRNDTTSTFVDDAFGFIDNSTVHRFKRQYSNNIV